MNGVEIVNTLYTYAPIISHWWLAGFLIATFIVAVIGSSTTDYDKLQKILLIIVVILIACIIISFSLLFIKTDEIVGTKYQVKISEEVSFVEFMDKYEILDQEGKIYTVKERGND